MARGPILLWALLAAGPAAAGPDSLRLPRGPEGVRAAASRVSLRPPAPARRFREAGSGEICAGLPEDLARRSPVRVTGAPAGAARLVGSRPRLAPPPGPDRAYPLLL